MNINKIIARIPIAAVSFVAFSSILILLGWYIATPLLQKLFPTILPTPPATAWMLLLAAAILYGNTILEKQEGIIKKLGNHRVKLLLNLGSWMLIVCNIFFLMITLWVVAGGYEQALTNYSTAVKALALQEPTNSLVSLRSAVAIILLGIAFMHTPLKNGTYSRRLGYAAFGSFLIALMSLLGYAYSASAMYMLPSPKPLGMALPTAMMIVALSGGLLLQYKEHISPLALLFQTERTAVLTQQRIIVTGVFSFILGWLALYAVEQEILNVSTAIATMVFALIVGLSWMLTSTGLSALRWEEERELALQELQNTEAELRKTISIRDRMYSVIAHDLRSPFAVITASAYLLRDDIERNPRGLNEDMVMCIRGIDTASQQLSTLLDNLLEWTRAQRGKISVSPAMVGVAALVEGIFPVYEHTFHKKEITFTVDIPLDVLVVVDKNMLHTVLRNLISNASKFTLIGGTITLKAEDNHDGTVTISIADTGVGMTKEVVGQLFDNTGFTTYGTNGEKGTGLGLGLCKEFIARNHGEIWVESTLGKGSTFFIRLPSPNSYSVGVKAFKASGTV